MPHWDEFKGQTPTELVPKFLSLWSTISKGDAELIKRRAELGEELYWADEVGLMDGTSPLLKELEPIADYLKKEAKRLDPGMSEKELRKFVFFVFHHDPNHPELVEAAKSAEEF
ncbi:MAG: hypothetical protein CMM52_15935 [Rhodospirillaceae bacterium]|nr:hypothetical protein [Rhodospirillaceae bacterium]|tara:strand:- start:4807 stop:5148 length:342 start_codon:yes stop_codon:yes gene_type:complete